MVESIIGQSIDLVELASRLVSKPIAYIDPPLVCVGFKIDKPKRHPDFIVPSSGQNTTINIWVVDKFSVVWEAVFPAKRLHSSWRVYAVDSKDYRNWFDNEFNCNWRLVPPSTIDCCPIDWELATKMLRKLADWTFEQEVLL